MLGGQWAWPWGPSGAIGLGGEGKTAGTLGGAGLMGRVGWGRAEFWERLLSALGLSCGPFPVPFCPRVRAGHLGSPRRPGSRDSLSFSRWKFKLSYEHTHKHTT